MGQTSVNPDFDVLAAKNWQKLLRHFELDKGFALIFILVPDQPLAELCFHNLNDWIKERENRSVLSLSIPDPSVLEMLPERLLLIEPEPDAAALWCAAVFPKPAHPAAGYDEWRRGWERASVKFNRVRDGISSRLEIPLLLIGAPWVREVVRDSAPDFWSIRTFVTELWRRVPREDLLVITAEQAGVEHSHFLDSGGIAEGVAEQEWIKVALNSNTPLEQRKAAFEKLVATYSDRVRMLLQNGGLPRSDAEDVTQAVWFRLWTSKVNFDVEQPFWPWLRAVARNSAFDSSRRGRRSLTDELEAMQDLPTRDESNPETLMRSREVLGLIDKLPERQRAVIKLVFEEFTLAEIAQALNWSLMNVEFLKRGAIAKLRQLAQDAGYRPSKDDGGNVNRKC